MLTLLLMPAGAAVQTFTYAATGGAVALGSVAPARTRAPSISGGVLATGSSAVTRAANIMAVGGSVVDGAVTIARTSVPMTLGGIVTGGAAELPLVKSYVGAGGMVSAGVADAVRSSVAAVGGDEVLGGVAAVSYGRAVLSVGGVNTTGAQAAAARARVAVLISSGKSIQGQAYYGFVAAAVQPQHQAVPMLAPLSHGAWHIVAAARGRSRGRPGLRDTIEAPISSVKSNGFEYTGEKHKFWGGAAPHHADHSSVAQHSVDVDTDAYTDKKSLASDRTIYPGEEAIVALENKSLLPSLRLVVSHRCVYEHAAAPTVRCLKGKAECSGLDFIAQLIEQEEELLLTGTL